MAENCYLAGTNNGLDERAVGSYGRHNRVGLAIGSGNQPAVLAHFGRRLLDENLYLGIRLHTRNA